MHPTPLPSFTYQTLLGSGHVQHLSEQTPYLIPGQYPVILANACPKTGLPYVRSTHTEIVESNQNNRGSIIRGLL